MVFQRIFVRTSVQILLLCTASILLLTSCQTAVTSRSVGDSQATLEGASGGIYYLPMALVEARLKQTDTLAFCAVNSDGAIPQNEQPALGLQRSYSLEYVATTIVPDPNAAHVIDYDESAWSSDKLVIDITSNGLLNKVSFKGEDQTGQVILKVVEAVKEGAKAFISAGPALGDAAAARTMGEQQKCQRFRYEELEPVTVLQTTFDPLDTASRSRSNNTVQDVIKTAKATSQVRGLPLTIERPQSSLMIEIATLARPVHGAILSNSCEHGICYRPAEPVDLLFKEDDHEIGRKTLVIPTKDRVGQIDISRASFVKKVTSIDFENGMLKQVDIDKPSEALAIASLPVDILKAIVSIPTELIQLKIDTTGKQKELVNARKDLTDAQRQLLETEKLLIDTQRRLLEKNTQQDPISATP